MNSNIMTFFKRMLNALWLLFSLLSILLMAGSIQAKDFVTIASDKTAVVDKVKGTAVWRKNVHVVRKSTGSNLTTDRLSIERDIVSKRIIWAEAIGNVKAVYFRSPTDLISGKPNANAIQGKNSHTTISCDLATFSRKTSIAVLSGTVNVQSRDFNLQAEKITYNYVVENGKVTARPGEQVRFVFYKKSNLNTLKQAVLRPESQRISGVADEILVDRSSLKSVLQGNVYAIDHSDQSQFRAARTELFFDENEEIETIIASGNFSMHQPDRVSKADRALFEYESEEVTLIGNAYVRENNNMEVSSARIKMYMKVNKGIISGVDDIPVKMKIEIE